MAVDPVRDAAVDVLLRLERKDMRLEESLEKTLRRKGPGLSARGRRFLSQLVYGTVRHQGLCDRVYEPFLTQPSSKLPDAIRVILRMGVFQSLFCNQVTFPAMVHTSVDLAKKRGHAGLAKVTNAVLRKVPQSLGEITFPDPETNLAAHLMVRYSMPQWLAHKWIQDLGAQTALEAARASCEEARITARVNTLRTSVFDLMTTLAKHGMTVTPRRDIQDAIEIDGGAGIIESKAFQQGLFTLQDAASMLPVHLLCPMPWERIVDLCCAPGGKTVQIAQYQERRPLPVRPALSDADSTPLRTLKSVSMPVVSVLGKERDVAAALEQLGYRRTESDARLLDRGGIEKLDLESATVSSDAIAAVDVQIVMVYGIIPIAVEDETLVIATADPTNFNMMENLVRLLERPIRPVYATPEAITSALHRFYGAETSPRIESLLDAPGVSHYERGPRFSELECPSRVFAVDLNPWRLERVVENVERLGLSGVHIAAGDANQPPFHDGSFDRVLLDAPCSGLGTLRRHPEIKWRLRPRSIRRLGEQQRSLLRSAIALCKNGGVIVYSVCTFTPEETEQVVEPFIQEGIVTPEDGPEWLNKWRISLGMYRTLPGRDPLDGFFLTRLRKRS